MATNDPVQPVRSHPQRARAKTLDQLRSLIDPSRKRQIDLLLVPHVAVDLCELAQYQTGLIADLGVQHHKMKLELAKLRREK